MRRMFNLLLAVTAGLLFSSIALAEGGAQSNGFGLGAIGAGLAMGLGALGAAMGQGNAAASALEGITRNPNSAKAALVPLLLSLAFMELVALLAFVVANGMVGKL